MVTAYGTFDPYQQWLGIPPHEQPPHHYRLLGLQPFEQDMYAISAAAERLLGYLGNVNDPHYATAASRLYEEIVNARLTLSDPYRKAQYDGWLAQALGAAAPQMPQLQMPGMGAMPQYAPAPQSYAAPAPAPNYGAQYGAAPAGYGTPGYGGAAPGPASYGTGSYGTAGYGAAATLGYAPSAPAPMTSPTPMQYGANVGSPALQSPAPSQQPVQQPVVQQPIAQQPVTPPAQQPTAPAPNGAAGASGTNGTGEPEVSFVTAQATPLMPPSRGGSGITRKSTLVKEHEESLAKAAAAAASAAAAGAAAAGAAAPLMPPSGGSGITRKSTLVREHEASLAKTAAAASAAAPAAASDPAAAPAAGFVPSSGFAPGSYSTGAYNSGPYGATHLQQPMQAPVQQAPMQQAPIQQPMAAASMPMQAAVQPLPMQYAPQPMVPSTPAAPQPIVGSPAPGLAAPGWQVGARPASPTETVEKQQIPWKMFGGIAAGLVGIIIIGVIRNMDSPRRPQGTVAANTQPDTGPVQPKQPQRVAPPPPSGTVDTEPKTNPVVEPPIVEPTPAKQVEPLPKNDEPEPKVELPKVEPKAEPKTKRVEPVEPTKVEPTKTEPTKTEPTKTEPPEQEPGTLPSQITTVVKPVTVDPNTDPTIDLAQAKKAAEMLDKARAAMARRDISLARTRLNSAKGLPKTTAQNQEHARLEMLCDQLDDFWSAIRKTMDSIKDMDDIEINQTRVGIVEITGDKMILRVKGVNKTYHVETMSQTLTMFLANRWYKPIPSSKIFKGAFMAMDAQGDRKQARELWEQAKREGGPDERDVVNLLLPELDVMLVTDAPGND